MKKVTKAVAAIMLTMAVVCAAGCKKDPDNGGNNSGIYNGHKYVDLGLPSGTLWATCNVGADSPEEYGDYFAWGETRPKDSYTWVSYIYAEGTSYSDPRLTKYCTSSSFGNNGFTDDLITLQPEDDAATANWGSGWCMPTADQWRELWDNTFTSWTNRNGVEGPLFTAANGNSLFLPAAGYRDEGSLYCAGSYGDYWSSSLGTDYPRSAWCFGFSSGDYSMGNDSRGCGLSVRAVRSGLQN